MKNVALITGASSGLGYEFSRIHARNRGDLVLIARRGELLEKIKSELNHEFGVSVEILAVDLTQNEAIDTIVNFLNDKEIEVDYLINNAGFGGYGKFHERDLTKEMEMINLNIVALTKLTHRLLPKMIQRKSGYILNIASVAGFMPGPLQSVYFATKSFVVSFTQGLARELSGTGVSVTALCPGPVVTGFEKTAGLEGGNLFRGAANPEKTAKIGYEAMTSGRLIVFNQWSYRFLINWIAPLIPRKVLASVVMKMQKID
jgi:short-subunit dehydrogenase